MALAEKFLPQTFAKEWSQTGNRRGDDDNVEFDSHGDDIGREAVSVIRHFAEITSLYFPYQYTMYSGNVSEVGGGGGEKENNSPPPSSLHSPHSPIVPNTTIPPLQFSFSIAFWSDAPIPPVK